MAIKGIIILKLGWLFSGESVSNSHSEEKEAPIEVEDVQYHQEQIERSNHKDSTTMRVREMVTYLPFPACIVKILPKIISVE